MLTVTLPAMVPCIAHPKRLCQVSTKVKRACFANISSMLVNAHSNMPSAVISSTAKHFPVEKGISRVMKSIFMGLSSDYNLQSAVFHWHILSPYSTPTFALVGITTLFASSLRINSLLIICYMAR
jgi:hypothetical protein